MWIHFNLFIIITVSIEWREVRREKGGEEGAAQVWSGNSFPSIHLTKLQPTPPVWYKVQRKLWHEN